MLLLVVVDSMHGLAVMVVVMLLLSSPGSHLDRMLRFRVGAPR